MYLKSLELVGFKSFADKTKLTFEPGITAIVGPNGCGKSNISDSIRWVLGEQSAKAMRGLHMQDCIFNGTDDKKPLGMAEVSLNLSDCEAALGTAYHEVTVTRRIFRSGESEYLINHQPCRLKDIQRLFMDTGVGMNAYSVLEQGRIDQILSTHPEDRRAIFEEASGITKYKADKKEAIRKLETTEANLARLADVLQEVRRQINSLQRQASKAQRYQEIQVQLRTYDVFLAKENSAELQHQINNITNRLAVFGEREEALQTDLTAGEKLLVEKREELSLGEGEINNGFNAVNNAQNLLLRAQETIRITKERLNELQSLAERDSRDLHNAKDNELKLQQAAKELAEKIAATKESLAKAEQELAAQNKDFIEADRKLEGEKRNTQLQRQNIASNESRLNRLQTELNNIELSERSTIVRHERLQADNLAAQQIVATEEARLNDSNGTLATLRLKGETIRNETAELSKQLAKITAQIGEKRSQTGQLQSQLAAKKAKIELLAGKDNSNDPFPSGAKFLRKPPADFPSGLVAGALADKIDVPDNYQTALEAILRAWSDAIIVHEPVTVLAELEKRQTGPARLVTSTPPQAQSLTETPAIGEPLLNHIEGDKALLQNLLQGVYVIKSLADLPSTIPTGITYVTLTGCVINARGLAEYWRASSPQDNPLTRHHLLHNLTEESKTCEQNLARLQEELKTLRSEEQEINQKLIQGRRRAEDSQREITTAETEQRLLATSLRGHQERRQLIAKELEKLQGQTSGSEKRREEIAQETAKLTAEIAANKEALEKSQAALTQMEQERQNLQGINTEARLRVASLRQEIGHLQSREQPLIAQSKSLDETIKERTAALAQYASRTQEFENQLKQATVSEQPLAQELAQKKESLAAAQKKCEGLRRELSRIEEDIREKRRSLDELRDRKSRCDVELAELRLRQQNILERIGREYRLSSEEIARTPEPDWGKDGRPPSENLESIMTDLKAKIEAMGPVNLVAIEEYKEFQERLTFLTGQQDDLVKSKDQLLDLIKKLNKTTTDMFAQTFNQVNENFQGMFTKLFNGGTAKLVLVDEADMLESGIEIIARPPGKKLQSISLLSGGERTMTAIALLFALYMVKASPFCVLDELDAALDESNIGRFVETVQGFVQKSQFIIVTHNRQTISAADVLYGVTMERRGISKLVSVKFDQPVS